MKGGSSANASHLRPSKIKRGAAVHCKTLANSILLGASLSWLEAIGWRTVLIVDCNGPIRGLQA